MADYLIDCSVEPTMDPNFDTINLVTLLDLNSNKKYTIDSSSDEMLTLVKRQAWNIFNYYLNNIQKFTLYSLNGTRILIHPDKDTILFSTSFEEHFNSMNLLFSSQLTIPSRDLITETPDLLKDL